jgi:hypothetical protein
LKVCSVLGEDGECRLVPIRPIYAGRRYDLGIGVRDMAAGLGIGLARLLSIEDGTAADEDKTFYRSWLSRIEGWSSSQRQMQLGRASAGQRFT